MKDRRKKAACLAACLLAALAVSACAGKKGSVQESGGETENPQEQTAAETAAAKDTEIALWTYPIGSWGSSNTVSTVLSAFHRAYPQYRVTLKTLDYNTGDQVVEEAIAAGEMPDLILEGPERLVANWGSRGLMADISDLWKSKKAGQIYEQIREACQNAEGIYYEYPLCMTAHCMAINYEMFEDAGALAYIDQENHTWTTDGFIEAVKALRDAGHERVGVVYCGGQGGDQGTRALVNNLYGGTFTNQEHTAYTMNSEENIKALRLLQDLDGIEFDAALAGGDEAALFANGELAMAFCWNASQEISQIVNNPNMNFDVFPMAFPAQDGAPRLPGGIWGFGVFDNKDADRLEAAKTFIRYITEDNEQYMKAIHMANYWPVRDIEGIYDNDELMTEYGAFTQYMDDYYQVAPGWADTRTAWWQMLQKVGEGEDPADALAEMEKTISGG